jgi:hypothetical protein
LLSEELASTFARAALAGTDLRHDMHWVLLRTLRLYPMLAENGHIAAALDAHLTPAAIEANPVLERPDDCAWALELQAEALRMRSRWARALAPLAQRLSSRMAEFAAQGSSAFACILALDYARAAGDLALDMEIRKAARRRYGAARDAPLADESLIEAVLMHELLEPAEFARWLNAFLPSGVGPLAEPPAAARPCFLRAWCFGALGLSDLAEKHLAAGMPLAAGGDYAFAVLALSAGALRTP